MKRIDFMILAASEYLANNTIDEKLIQDLENQVKLNKHHWSETEITIWKPFESLSLREVLLFIEELADKFEQVYNKGLEDDNGPFDAHGDCGMAYR